MLYYKNEKELINMLTKSEEEILDLLWTENRPMTSTEIVNLSVNRTWKKSYIHLLINSLLKKEVIKVEGFVKTTKTMPELLYLCSQEKNMRLSNLQTAASLIKAQKKIFLRLL